MQYRSLRKVSGQTSSIDRSTLLFWYELTQSRLKNPAHLLRIVEQHKGDSWRKLSLPGPDGSLHDFITPGRPRPIESLKAFTRLEELEIPATWLIIPPETSKSDNISHEEGPDDNLPVLDDLPFCCGAINVMEDLNPPFRLTDVLPPSLRYLGLGFPSTIGLEHRPKSLSREFGTEVSQKLPKLKCLRFEQAKRDTVSHLEADLELEVGRLRYNWPWLGDDVEGRRV